MMFEIKFWEMFMPPSVLIWMLLKSSGDLGDGVGGGDCWVTEDQAAHRKVMKHHYMFIPLTPDITQMPVRSQYISQRIHLWYVYLNLP